MTQAGSVSQVTVKAEQVTSLGTIVAGTLIANTSTASAIYVSQSTSVSATNGLRVGPLGSVSWTDSTPCYIAVDGQLDVTVTLSTVSANLSSPLDVADAIHKDGVSISGPVTIDGTVPIDGTVTITSPVDINGTVPITGTVNANISGPVTVETSAGTPLDVNATGTVSLTGPVTVESGSTPLDVSGSTVNVNPVTITGTVPVSGDVGITGPVAISGTVPISGDVGINAPVAISGTVPISGDVGITGGVAISGPVAISGTVPISGDVGVSGPVTVTGTVDATIPGNVTVITPAGTPLDVTVPGTVAVSAIGSTVNIATPSPIDVVASGTVNVNPVTIEGTVPVTGTVELGSGTTVGINGSVDLSGPVTIDGNVTVTNTLNTMGVTTQLSQITYNGSHLGPDNTDVSGYASILVQISGPSTGTGGDVTIGFITNGTTFDHFVRVNTQHMFRGMDFVIPNYSTTVMVSYATIAPAENYVITIYGLSTLVSKFSSPAALQTIITVNSTTTSAAAEVSLFQYVSGELIGTLKLWPNATGSYAIPDCDILIQTALTEYTGILGTIPAQTITQTYNVIYVPLHGVAPPAAYTVSIVPSASSSTALPAGLNFEVSITAK